MKTAQQEIAPSPAQDSGPDEGQDAGRFAKVAQCLYRHRSSRVYYALVKKSGKQFRKSLNTADRKLAERRLTAFKTTVERVRPHPSAAASDGLFETVANRWLAGFEGLLKRASFRRREGALARLNETFAGKLLKEISVADCEHWASKRSLASSASTFNKERETLIAVFNYALRDGFVLENPAARLRRRKMPSYKLTIPSREQFQKLVAALRNADVRYEDAANLAELLAYSGLRLAEAVALRWDDIDWNRGCFTVTGGETGTKNHEARVVPLFPALTELLARLKSRVQAEPAGRIIGIGTARKAIASACKKAGLPAFTHHSLRHYFCSNAIEAGVDFKVIAAWLGHKDGGILVAKTYGHLRDAHSFEMAKRMTFSAVPKPAAV